VEAVEAVGERRAAVVGDNHARYGLGSGVGQLQFRRPLPAPTNNPTSIHMQSHMQSHAPTARYKTLSLSSHSSQASTDSPH
jgi:hypothetical protein